MSYISTNLREDFRHETVNFMEIFESDRPEYYSAMYSVTSVSISGGVIGFGTLISGRGLAFFESLMTVIGVVGTIIAYSLIILLLALLVYFVAHLRRRLKFKEALNRSCEKLEQLKKAMIDAQNQHSDQFQEELDSIDYMLESIGKIIGGENEQKSESK